MRRAKIWIGTGALALVVLLAEQATRTRAEMPPHRTGMAPAARPNGDEFSKVPIAATYGDRRRMYLDWASRRETPSDRSGIVYDLLKLESGAIDQASEGALRAALEFVNSRKDPSDFTVAGLVRLYYLHANDGGLKGEQASGIRSALVGYKYSLDEPGESMTEMWTENHQILSLSSQYLAGQKFADVVFTNDGLPGREHMRKARERLVRWIDFHARTGMAEWDSVPYYNMDVAALLNLAEFAGEEEIRLRAAMMVDLLLFDAAVDSFYGQLGTSHGRTTAGNVRSAAGDRLLNFQSLVFGRGRFQSVDMASAFLVTGRRYEAPRVLEEIGQDSPDEAINYERHSIPLTEAAARQFGLSLKNVDDFETFWGMGAFSNPEAINLMLDAVKTHNLWHYSYFRGLRPLANFVKPLGLAPTVSRLLNPDSNGTLMSEVNKVSYRTPDAMLSTAQDYRRGEKGYQQHIWQATLGPYAVVFVTNPDALDLDGRPSYWAGNGRMPRVAQHRNVLIAIHDIDRHKSPFGLEGHHRGFTHAWFPKWAFDEVREARANGAGGWVFGRVGEGYVGLYSHSPFKWTEEGPDAGQELIAPGLTNAWICQIGRRATDGSFDEFVRKVAGGRVEVRGTKVSYNAEGIGMMKLDWSGPFEVGNKPVALRGYRRWDNAYAQVEFGSRRFHIARGARSLDLDFEGLTRKAR